LLSNNIPFLQERWMVSYR